MRPLIIKVNDHKVESNNKVIGAINLDLNLPKKENLESPIIDNGETPLQDDAKNFGGLASSSLVRNLISRYENPSIKPPHTLSKFKSKSMIDLQKPKSPTSPKTQDDHLYNRDQYDSEEAFDFKKILNKFKSIDNSSDSVRKYNPKQIHYAKKEVKTFDLSVIRQKARMLLLDTPSLEDSFDSGSYWQRQVVELLEEICGDELSNPITFISKKNRKFDSRNNRKPIGNIRSLIYSDYEEVNGIDETDLKQGEMEGSTISSSVKDIKKYFETEKYIPYKSYTKQEEVEAETEEAEYSSDSTDSFNTVQTAGSPTTMPTSFFEEDKKIKLVNLDDLKNLVDDLIDEIRHYEDVINKITSDDTRECAEMNDALYNILLKLENIKAYGDEELLNKRKDAIQFVQTCIAQLKA